MGHTTALAKFLLQQGFRRHTLVRNQIGHLQLVGLLQDTPVDILIDTGAAIRSSIFPTARRRVFRHATLASLEAEPGA